VNHKSPVTLSELETDDDIVEGITCYQRYIYVECSMCEQLSHMARVSVMYEKNKSDGKISFCSVDFQLPLECFIEPCWRRIKQGIWAWICRKAYGLWFRISTAFKVLFRSGVLYLSPSMDLSLQSTKLLGQKLIEVADEAEK